MGSSLVVVSWRRALDKRGGSSYDWGMTTGMQVTEKDVTLMGAGRPTIYGNYVAPAIAGPAWHIQGERPNQALCGRPLSGDLRRMNLHVSLLECSRCMALGGAR